MGNINVRGIDDQLKLGFKRLAAAKGRSMEAELRDMIVKVVTAQTSPRNIGQSIRARFMKHGGVTLDLPARSMPRQRVTFEE